VAFKPGDRRVVRYAAIYEAGSGRWLWTWTPWQTSVSLPDGVGYKLPANAKLKVEIGYRAAEDATTDKSEVGLYFGDTPARRETSTIVLRPSAPVVAKPGAAAVRSRSEFAVPGAVRGLAIWPELGEGATALEVSAIAPDGVVEPLLWLKDVHADWPSPYWFRSAVPFARGTRLVMTMYHENTTDKPLNATPRVTVVTAP
jgi:hypothetical protein